MTITNESIEPQKHKCENMELSDNSRSQYTIGSNDFIRK
jgi:hypothetical protein